MEEVIVRGAAYQNKQKQKGVVRRSEIFLKGFLETVSLKKRQTHNRKKKKKREQRHLMRRTRKHTLHSSLGWGEGRNDGSLEGNKLESE